MRATPLGGSRLSAPRHAVCYIVLNLLAQVGDRPPGSALAEAYRIPYLSKIPRSRVLAQNLTCHITITAGTAMVYHDYQKIAIGICIPSPTC